LLLLLLLAPPMTPCGITDFRLEPLAAEPAREECLTLTMGLLLLLLLVLLLLLETAMLTV
jgi:hypothetical protein